MLVCCWRLRVWVTVKTSSQWPSPSVETSKPSKTRTSSKDFSPNSKTWVTRKWMSWWWKRKTTRVRFQAAAFLLRGGLIKISHRIIRSRYWLLLAKSQVWTICCRSQIRRPKRKPNAKLKKNGLVLKFSKTSYRSNIKPNMKKLSRRLTRWSLKNSPKLKPCTRTNLTSRSKKTLKSRRSNRKWRNSRKAKYRKPKVG